MMRMDEMLNWFPTDDNEGRIGRDSQLARETLTTAYLNLLCLRVFYLHCQSDVKSLLSSKGLRITLSNARHGLSTPVSATHTICITL